MKLEYVVFQSQSAFSGNSVSKYFTFGQLFEEQIIKVNQFNTLLGKNGTGKSLALTHLGRLLENFAEHRIVNSEPTPGLSSDHFSAIFSLDQTDERDNQAIADLLGSMRYRDNPREALCNFLSSNVELPPGEKGNFVPIPCFRTDSDPSIKEIISKLSEALYLLVRDRDDGAAILYGKISKLHFSNILGPRAETFLSEIGIDKQLAEIRSEVFYSNTLEEGYIDAQLGFRINSPFSSYWLATVFVKDNDILIPLLCHTQGSGEPFCSYIYSIPQCADLSRGIENVEGYIEARIGDLSALRDQEDEAIESLGNGGEHRHVWLEANQQGQHKIGDLVQYQVKPSIHQTVKIFETWVNLCLPSFVREQFDVKIKVKSPDLWFSHSSRVSVRLKERTSPFNSFSLESASQGTRKWVILALQLVGHAIANEPWRFEEDDGKRTHLSLANQILLLDEPESFLHPGAIQSVITWIHDVMNRGAQVFVATHSFRIFDLMWPEWATSRLMSSLNRVGSFSLRKVDFEGDELEKFSRDLGISMGEILLEKKIILFVEGRVDQALIQSVYPNWISQARVAIFPLHGDKEIELKVQLQVIQHLPNQCRILLDGPLHGVSRNVDEQRLIDFCTKQGPLNILGKEDVSRYDYRISREADIWFYVPEDVIFEIAKRFSSEISWLATPVPFLWTQVKDENAGKSMKQMKRYVKEHFNIDLTRVDIALAVGSLMREQGISLGQEVEENLAGLIGPHIK